MLRRFVPIAVLAATAVTAPPAGSPTAQGDGGPAPMIHAGPGGRTPITGPWTVRLDPRNHGSLKGYQAGSYPGVRAAVPHVPEAGRVAGEPGIRTHRGSVAWYRTTFAVPADGHYAIRFESVHHKATVWVDGNEVGRHKGAYLPFELRLKLKGGVTHTLVVRADWRGPAAMKRDGWHRTWFNFGGINREVTIRPLGTSELMTPTMTTRLSPQGAVVDVTVRVRNRARVAREVPVKGVLTRDGERVDLEFPALSMAPGQVRVVHAQATVPEPKLWEPGSPNLYDLFLEVPGESSYTQRVGLRQLRWQGSKLWLNGKRLRLHGASIHEDARGRGDGLTVEDMDQIVASLKAIGANATRSQHQLNPALLERFDAAGILVWQGLGPVDAPGSWTSKTRRQAATARRRVRETYFQTQAHPSVIAWNLANEVAGNGHPDGQAPFIDTMARWLHRRDPGRLVAVDVWGAHPPKEMGLLYRNLDAIAVTNYVGWYENPGARGSRLRPLVSAKVRKFERAFRGKVLVISEFGAEANAENAPRSPGGYEYQASFLSDHIRVYRRHSRVSGMLAWNLRDFAVAPSFAGGSIRRLVPGIKLVRGVNQKGLFDYDGRPKPAVDAVARQYGALGTGLTGG